jgi:hypothetical protein
MLLPLLAAALPLIVDILTPDGNAPKTGADGGMGQIGDLLGGLLGGPEGPFPSVLEPFAGSARHTIGSATPSRRH